MASSDYYEQIEEAFEAVEVALESLPDDVDIRGAEGVINATFSNGVVFVFSRQPPTEQLWLATPGGGFHYTWHDDTHAWLEALTVQRALLEPSRVTSIVVVLDRLSVRYTCV